LTHKHFTYKGTVRNTEHHFSMIQMRFYLNFVQIVNNYSRLLPSHRVPRLYQPWFGNGFKRLKRRVFSRNFGFPYAGI